MTTKPNWEERLKKIPATIIHPDGSGSKVWSIEDIKEYRRLVSLIRQEIANAKREGFEEMRKKLDKMAVEDLGYDSLLSDNEWNKLKSSLTKGEL